MTTMLPCPLFQLTGYQCPFCGGQRALIAIIHGDITQAFLLNPVLFVTMPYLIAVILSMTNKKFEKTKTGMWCLNNKVIFTMIGIYAIWGVFRNIY